MSEQSESGRVDYDKSDHAPQKKPGIVDYVKGAAKVYQQLGSDFIAQAKGKKLDPATAEYK